MNKQNKRKQKTKNREWKHPQFPDDADIKDRIDKIWERYRHLACTLDIEVKHTAGGIALVGISRWYNESPEYIQLIAGKNLSKSSLKKGNRLSSYIFPKQI